jgi:hypothetical protein
VTDPTEAIEVRTAPDRLHERDYDEHIDLLDESVESLMREVVEEGTFQPETQLEAEVTLALKERVTGIRSQDVTAVFLIGLILGSALERDVPSSTEYENAWRDKEFTLPQ